MQGEGAEPMLLKDDMMTQRTTTDIVFDKLHQEISSLRLLPGSKISEAEIASSLGVSRQPVRDAFNRLNNLGLLLIRPQRATEVRGFSMREIQNARFIRLAVELELISRACTVWDEVRAEQLDANLAKQRAVVASGKTDTFHELDYEFHRMICDLSGHPLAFETIERCKHVVDRLCRLSFDREDEVSAILADHEKVAAALASGSEDEARATVRLHLSRLDDTISEIHSRHAEYFEEA